MIQQENLKMGHGHNISIGWGILVNLSELLANIPEFRKIYEANTDEFESCRIEESIENFLAEMKYEYLKIVSDTYNKRELEKIFIFVGESIDAQFGGYYDLLSNVYENPKGKKELENFVKNYFPEENIMFSYYTHEN